MEKFSGTPSWAKDHLEGLESIKADKELALFHAEWPGINRVFENLIEMLPRADSNHEEFPIAAAVVRKNDDGTIEILSKATNEVNKRGDSTQHAEMVAIQEAQQVIGDKHLKNCMLLTTLQPCLMCTGAIEHSDIKSVTYGARQSDVRDTHLKTPKGFKPFRTVDTGTNPDEIMSKNNIEVFPDYQRDEVLRKTKRLSGSFKEYYTDPDS